MKQMLSVLTLSTLVSACGGLATTDGSGTNAGPQAVQPSASQDKPAEARLASEVRIPMEISLHTPNGQRYPDSVLRVVDKSDRALDVGLLVVGALLGSFRLPVAKEDYRGTKVETMRHPAMQHLFGGITATMAGQQEGKSGRQYKNPLYARPDTFALVYADSEDEKPPYELFIQTTVWRKPDSGGWLTSPVMVVCRDTFSASAFTLSQWEMEDYAAVKAKGEEHIRNCVGKVELALNELFKE
ncbi:hypothetical protein ACY05_00590 [Sterolibacterium denitrificans]|uniref:Lipoprotein n=2 Tax=Sterolibacterium denitrificans TaxID=157592 RepID=A0A656Z7R5_9PROT|nr:hypothetical protein [Sterolibacterium denitrificans]KYC29113.1 hypothetical protein ACY05_00590 [Sterolibacterium denitrificans]